MGLGEQLLMNLMIFSWWNTRVVRVKGLGKGNTILLIL